jgi:NAD(P)-dependent dehydrogenase (short-subunit alcohol dehydrogenase family)
MHDRRSIVVEGNVRRQPFDEPSIYGSRPAASSELAKSPTGGAIVNMSSIRGIAGAANTGAYCAAKGGVRMFTKATALECAALGNGVRANSSTPDTSPRP